MLYSQLGTLDDSGATWGCSALAHDVAPSRMMSLKVWDIKGTCFLKRFWLSPLELV